MLLLHHHRSDGHNGPPPLAPARVDMLSWEWTWSGLGGVEISWELTQEQQQRGSGPRLGEAEALPRLGSSTTPALHS